MFGSSFNIFGYTPITSAEGIYSTSIPEPEQAILTPEVVDNHSIEITNRVNAITKTLFKIFQGLANLSDIVVLYDNDPSSIIINALKQGNQISETFVRIARLITTLDMREYSVTHDKIDSVFEYFKNIQILTMPNVSRYKGTIPFKQLKNLQCLNLSDSNINDGQLFSLASSENLQILNLSGCIRVTGIGLSNLANLTVLCSLTLKCCDIKDTSLNSLVNCSALTYLDLSNCRRITDACLKALAKTFLALKFLHLKYCQNITDRGIADLTNLPVGSSSSESSLSLEVLSEKSDVKTIKSKLVSIDLRNTHITGKSLGIITKQLLALQHLSLSGPNITNDSLAQLASLSFLRSLNLSDCHGITDDVIVSLSHLSSLRSLVLKRCNITGKCLNLLAEHLPALSYLNLRGCRIAEEDLNQITKTFPNIQSLNLRSCKITDIGLKKIAEIFPNLQSLNLRSCRITDEGLAYLVNLKNLQFLDLGDCHDITNKSLELIGRNFPNLKSLNLSYCFGITYAGFAHLENLNYLQFINLRGCNVVGNFNQFLTKGCKLACEGLGDLESSLEDVELSDED